MWGLTECEIGQESLKFSGEMSTRFPSLFPKLSDPLWFDIDKPFEDENQLAEEEKEHQNWVNF